MVKEGWGPGLQDAECFMACDPTAGFVGELNGKPIGCMTMAKYGDRFAFGGCYFVSKEFRGREYGKKIYDAAIAIGSISSRFVSPRSLPHTTAGSLVYPLYFLTNHSQACSNRAGFLVIGQFCHSFIQHGGCQC